MSINPHLRGDVFFGSTTENILYIDYQSLNVGINTISPNHSLTIK